MDKAGGGKYIQIAAAGRSQPMRFTAGIMTQSEITAVPAFGVGSNTGRERAVSNRLA
jgi:hypothetical protein